MKKGRKKRRKKAKDNKEKSSTEINSQTKKTKVK